MGIFDWMKKDGPKGPDPINELNLSSIKVGWFVDYDLKTWEVTAANTYDWGEGDVSWEWQLRSGDETVYLELERDDEDYWTLSRKLDFSRLGPGVKEHILAQDDPPEELVFEGRTYFLDETAGGHFLKDGQGLGAPLLRWSYSDEEGKKLLEIEQWGEVEFEASLGIPVAEYQFVNILPRQRH